MIFLDVFSLACNISADSLCSIGNLHHETDKSIAEFQWSVGQGETPSHETGPSKDHDTNSEDGYYLYLEASRVSVKKLFYYKNLNSYLSFFH